MIFSAILKSTESAMEARAAPRYVLDGIAKYIFNRRCELVFLSLAGANTIANRLWFLLMLRPLVEIDAKTA
jgi:hypothetical protein